MSIDDIIEDKVLNETLYETNIVDKLLASSTGLTLYAELLLGLYSQHCSHSLIPTEQHEDIMIRELQKLIDNQYII